MLEPYYLESDKDKYKKLIKKAGLKIVDFDFIDAGRKPGTRIIPRLTVTYGSKGYKYILDYLYTNGFYQAAITPRRKSHVEDKLYSKDTPGRSFDNTLGMFELWLGLINREMNAGLKDEDFIVDENNNPGGIITDGQNIDSIIQNLISKKQ